MRLAALSIICFLACTVLGAPLPGPPVKAPAKAPTNASKPSGSGSKPANTKPGAVTKPGTGQTPAQAPANGTKGKPTKGCSGKKKRAPSPVKDAWLAKGAYVGGGAKGRIYDLPQGFNGHAEAVIKEVRDPQDKMAPGPEAEVRNLVAVGQFLGWGKTEHDQEDNRSAVYIVMKKMGVTLAKSGLTPALALPLEDAARARYLATYHMENKDLKVHGDNFVYRKVGTQWQAEIIDWEKATTPSTTPAPAAEAIDFFCVPGAFPTR